MRLIEIELNFTNTYLKVLAHRNKCPKWDKSFCLECFGGGLGMFTENLFDELDERYNLRLRTIKK